MPFENLVQDFVGKIALRINAAVLESGVDLATIARWDGRIGYKRSVSPLRKTDPAVGVGGGIADRDRWRIKIAHRNWEVIFGEDG